MNNHTYSKIFIGKNITIYDLGSLYQEVILISFGGVMLIDNYLSDFEQVIESIKERKAKICIADFRQLKTISDALIDWIHDIWYPKCYENGLRHQIVINSENVMGQLGMDKIITKTDNVHIIKAKTLAVALKLTEDIIEEERVNELMKKLGL